MADNAPRYRAAFSCLFMRRSWASPRFFLRAAERKAGGFPSVPRQSRDCNYCDWVGRLDAENRI